MPKLSEEESECLLRNKEAVQAFEAFCRGPAQMKGLRPEDYEYLGQDPWEETDFHDLSLGFFVAKGCTMKDCFVLARIVRYTFEYWC